MSIHASRRDMFKLGLGVATLATASRASTFSRNGPFIIGSVREAGSGRGLPGVRLSNGRDIVMTDSDGLYRLQVQPDDVPFLIKPEGYAPVLDDMQLPQVHALPGTVSMDFLLKEQEEPARFDVLMLADPQPGNTQEMSFLANIVSMAAQEQYIRFAITLGDLVGDEPNLYTSYNGMMAQIGAPVWNLPGNHDLDFSAPNAIRARKFWRETYGPGTRAFDYGPATFILLDNIGWGAPKGAGHAYIGEIGPDNLAFVEALLATTPDDRLIVLCMHIPLTSAADPGDLSCQTHDRTQLLQLLAGRNCISFSGHMHTYERHFIQTPDGALHDHRVLNAISGSWWTGPYDSQGYPIAQSCDGTPNGWYVLAVDGPSTSLRFESARSASSLRVMLTDGTGPNCNLLSHRVTSTVLKNSHVLANVFAGGPRTKVHYTLSANVAQPMQRVSLIDPSTDDLFRQAGVSRKSWVEPVASTHLWHSRLPSTLAAGTHRLDVHVVDDDGRIHRTTHVFEVVDG